jgi:hypothetical protein
MQARCAEIIREDKLFAEVYRKSGWQGKVFLPLIHLKHEVGFKWGDEQRWAFEKIKEYLASPPVLQAPHSGKGFNLYIAVQERAIGAVFSQEDSGKEFAIAYLSRRLSDTEGRYTFIRNFVYRCIICALNYIVIC